MPSTLSPRAISYLSTLRRVPEERDRSAICAALEQAGVAPADAFVEFQIDFGGYVEMYGRNRYEWTILCQDPEPYSPLSPNRVSSFQREGQTMVTCANCHGSDHWFMDTSGAIYWCFTPPLVSSFQKKIEQDALVAQFRGRVQEVRFERPFSEIAELLLQRVRDYLVTGPSDQYQSFYLHPDLLAIVKGEKARVYLLGNSAPALLEGIQYRVRS